MSAMSGTGSGQNSGQSHRRQAGSMKAMFGFLTPHGKDSGDPLQSAKSGGGMAAAVAGARRDRPAAARHPRARRDAQDAARRSILNRVSAIQFVDAALGADRRQLIKQYIENAESSPKLADRIWQALWEMSQAFTLAYQPALESALHAGGQRALEAGAAAAVRAPRPFPRHRRQAARVQVRALDPGQVDGAASGLPARVRDAVRSRSRWRCRPPARRRSRGRSSRNTCTCCWCISSTPAT